MKGFELMALSNREGYAPRLNGRARGCWRGWVRANGTPPVGYQLARLRRRVRTAV